MSLKLSLSKGIIETFFDHIRHCSSLPGRISSIHLIPYAAQNSATQKKENHNCQQLLVLSSSYLHSVMMMMKMNETRGKMKRSRDHSHDESIAAVNNNNNKRIIIAISDDDDGEDASIIQPGINDDKNQFQRKKRKIANAASSLTISDPISSDEDSNGGGNEVKEEYNTSTPPVVNNYNRSSSMIFNPLPPSTTFAMNKTSFSGIPDEKSGDTAFSFWFEDLFQPPTVDPPARLSTYLKRVFLSTYNVDLEWLFSNREPHRRLCYAENIVLVHGSRNLQSDLTQFVKMNPSVPFCQMITGKKLQLHFPELKLEYGTQHGKIYLIYFENSVRVVITTSNLTKRDWKEKLQGTWIQEFPRKKKQTISTTSITNDFERTLVDYLTKLQLADEAKLIREFDFSGASATLITSCPGYYSKNQLYSYGHMKVRKILSKLPFCDTQSTPHCLFSSLGTLNEAYLNQELLTSFSIPSKSTLRKSSNLAIIWPTIDFVRKSIVGTRGADHYCAAKKKFKAFILNSLYQWDPFRERHLSHTKMYMQTQVSKSEDSRITIPWIFLTSSNLSKAAHGQLIHNGSTLMVRSFEIGVLFTPTPNQVFVPSQETTSVSNQQSSSTSSGESVISFPVPYKLPLRAYNAKRGDVPWCDEEAYNDNDNHDE